MTVVYIVNPNFPLRQIVAREAEIVKFTKAWAEIRTRGQFVRRHLLGATAFQTEASARRAKLAHLTRLSKNRWIQAVRQWMHDEVCNQLADPAHKGWQIRAAQ